MGLNRRLFLVSLGSSGVLVACGGGGGTTLPPSGGGTPTPKPTGTPTPTPAPTATPTPTAPPNTIALTISNNSAVASSNIQIYVFGQDSGNNWVYLNHDWTTSAWSQTSNIPGIPFYAGGNGSGSSSQTIYLPQLTAARVFIAQGSLPIPNDSSPAPWNGDGSVSVPFDWIEYTWNAASNGITLNSTAVDQLGLPLTINLIGKQNQTIGFKSGAFTQINSQLQALGSPWNLVNSQWSQAKRILNPKHIFAAGNTFGGSPSQFDSVMKTAWELYKNNTFTLGSTFTDGSTTLYGRVDSSDNFNFYSDAGLTNLVLTISSPFTTGDATYQAFAGAGVFVPAGQLGQNVGRDLVACLNRGIMDTTSGGPVTVTELICTSSSFYPGRPYQNEFARIVHSVANDSTYGFNGLAYAFSYDDACNLYSSAISDASPAQLNVTINTP